MASSTTPLTDQEIEQLLSRLPSQPDRDRMPVLLLLFTGMHPSVLSDPLGHSLQLDGDRYLQWRRPKTRRFIRVPIVPELRSWIRDYLFAITPAHRQYYGRLVERVCRACGIRGATARTLRHTYAKLVYRKTRDVNESVRLVGCTAAQMLEYARAEEGREDARISSEGLGP